MKYRTTTLSVAIHPPGENPMFSDAATHVSIEDEGGGPFLVIRQQVDHPRAGEVRLDANELDQVIEAGRQLLTQASLSI